MQYRDPRVLSDALDTNSGNWLTPPPEAESVPDADRLAGTSSIDTPATTNMDGSIPLLTPIDDDRASHGSENSLEYPSQAVETNVTRGPNERDEALDRSRGLTGTNEPTGPIDAVESAALKRAPVGTGPKTAD